MVLSSQLSLLFYIAEDVGRHDDDMSWDAMTDRASDHVFFKDLFSGMAMTLGRFFTFHNFSTHRHAPQSRLT